MTEQETYAEKIAKLLRKAESTKFPEEAETLISKAQELMLKYAIDEEMLARAAGKEMKDEIGTTFIVYTGSMQQAIMQLGLAIARANGCKLLLEKRDWAKESVLHVIGFKSDRDHVVMLDTSVQIQCTHALTVWWKAQDKAQYETAGEKWRARREFIYGFAQGVQERLTEARKAATQEATVTHGPGVGLVLVSKKAQLDEYWDGLSKGKGRTSHRQSGGRAARDAGHTAGRNVDAGHTGVRGAKGSLR